MHIRTKNDLICWLEDNAPTRAIARAVEEGQIENLGAFEQVLSGIDPGWIVRVTSVYNKTWYVAVKLWVKSSIFPGYKAYILEEVPWERWVGEHANNKLYRGDKPLQYKELHNARKTEKRGSDNTE